MEDYEIDDLKTNLRDYLESHSINTSKMFRCINPNHSDSNASMKYFDDNKVYCFGCCETYNLFDVISIFENVDKKEAFKRAINYYKRNTQMPKEKPTMKSVEAKKHIDKDYGKAYKFWKKNFEENKEAQNYVLSRGISLETAKRFEIGYNKFNFKEHELSAIIIPNNTNCFTARNINKDNKDFRYYKPTGCHTDIFNKEALTNEIPYCFITEGEFDCLSFETCGFNSIALGGVNNINKFIENERDNKKTYIIALDNDEIGQQAQEQLVDFFKENKLKYTTFNNIGCKDANKALTEFRDLFVNAAKELTQKIIKKQLKNQSEM